MKKLIIVCEEKLRQYGDFLAQLISFEGDENNQGINLKKTLVAAQVWTEKEYNDNAAQISSEQYILFIGNSKLIRSKRSYMKTEFLEHGMQYGWLGKQGVLFVGQALSIDKYDDFYEYAREIKPEIEKLIDRGPKELMMLYENIVEKNEETAKIKKLLIPIKELKTKMSTVGKLGKNFYNQVTYNKKIEAQQYSCLILSFYFDGLSRFLGLGEE